MMIPAKYSYSCKRCGYTVMSDCKADIQKARKEHTACPMVRYGNKAIREQLYENLPASRFEEIMPESKTMIPKHTTWPKPGLIRSLYKGGRGSEASCQHIKENQKSEGAPSVMSRLAQFVRGITTKISSRVRAAKKNV